MAINLSSLNISLDKFNAEPLTGHLRLRRGSVRRSLSQTVRLLTWRKARLSILREQGDFLAALLARGRLRTEPSRC